MQLRSKKDGIHVTTKDMISSSQKLNEASSAEELPPFFDGIATAISCCRLFVQDRALPSACVIVIAGLDKDDQQHRLPGTIECSKASRNTTVSFRLASSNECSEAIVRVCKELSRKGVSLELMYFTPATLYQASLGEKICAGLLVFCPLLLSEKLHNFGSYCTEFYNADFAFLEKAKTAATPASHPLC